MGVIMDCYVIILSDSSPWHDFLVMHNCINFLMMYQCFHDALVLISTVAPGVVYQLVKVLVCTLYDRYMISLYTK